MYCVRYTRHNEINPMKRILHADENTKWTCEYLLEWHLEILHEEESLKIDGYVSAEYGINYDHI